MPNIAVLDYEAQSSSTSYGKIISYPLRLQR